MSEDKFTPGPWGQYAGHVYAPGDKGANVASISSPRKNELVGYCELRIGDPDIKEAFANAALIAAAPDMYEALQAALPLHEANGNEQTAAQIRAALAKAVKP